MQKTAYNGSDRYAAKCKHRLGSEHAFKYTAKSFFSQLPIAKLLSAQSSSVGWRLRLHASNETQHINVWLLFLIAIIDILDKEPLFGSLYFLQNHFVYSQKLSRMD